jgi:glycosyltransferase involved in cell wall biosynthesis
MSNGMNERHRKPNVGIFTHPFFARAGYPALDNIIALLSPLTSKLFIITGGAYDNTTSGTEIFRIRATERKRLLSKILDKLFVDIRVIHRLSKLRREMDILIFFHGSNYPVPLLFARSQKITCLLVMSTLGSARQILAVKQSGAPGQWGERVRLRLSEVLERISYFFADKLIAYSPSIVDEIKLHQYSNKVVIARHSPVDFERYGLKNDIVERENVVGYIGRLSEEKGILNLLQAIPEVLSKRNDVRFLIVGEGSLEDTVRAYLDAHALGGRVSLRGWISHDELPDCFARLKLLVLPSYTEGLPAVVLEAMACGTPVLATSVGAVSDVLKDDETGFLLNDNSPACLVEGIATALAYPDLRRIVTNARALVESEFRYETLAEAWRDIICRQGPVT